MKTDSADRDLDSRRRAIDPRSSFIVQAPAGSGKTSLLTMRYLRLLADVDSPEQIIAVTFTRKAAAEMRHRILQALSESSGPASADAAPHELEIRRLAGAALAASQERGWGLEHNPSRLHVQTIDGLNHWLARRLPLAARIGSSAMLVDDARPLYAEAARRTVAMLDSAEPAAAELERLARALNHEPTQLAGLIEVMLGTRELWLPKILEPARGPALRVSIDRLLESAIETELARARAAVAAAGLDDLLAIVREAAALGAADGPLIPLAALDDWPAPTVASVPQWTALADLLLKAGSGAEFRKTVDRRQGFLAASEGGGWVSLKRRMIAQLEAVAGKEDLAVAFARLRSLPPRKLSADQWERIDALSGVLPLAVAQLLALFAERDRLDHAAVAAAAREALGGESAPTELALALDYRIRHLLVDEYQDTSPSQERLLELLVAGWLPGDGRSLFCVGDPMQSIYAFREADVTLFLEAQHQGIGGVRLETERLSRNFRSSAAIVDWVNATFGRLLPAGDDFERGAVRYSAATAQGAGGAKDGVVVHALIDSDEDTLAARTAAVVAGALGDPDESAQSVAVLVRGRASLPPLLAALRRAGIEYRGVELESLLDRPAIRDLVTLAKAMLHAGDRTAWLAVLRAPWCGLTLRDLLAIAGGDRRALIPQCLADVTAIAALSEDGRIRVETLWRRLRAAIETRGERSLGSWLKSAWLALAGPATVGDSSDIANAELLFDALDRLELEAGCCPEASLIDAAVEGVMASPVGSESARVQIMTIHRAKGLEFDVVIVPDLQRGVRGGDRPLLYWTPVTTAPSQRGIVLASRAEVGTNDRAADPLEQWMRRLAGEREALELGRLAYVAATRARRELHLIGAVRTQTTEAGPELRRPRTGSLLSFFWPVLAGQFEQALAVCAGATEPPTPRTRRELSAPPPVRLPLDFIPPAPETPSRSLFPRIVSEAEGSIRPDFDWAGTIAQAVGHVVHLELYRLAEARRAPTTLVPRPAEWQRLLREFGVDDAHLPKALTRIDRAMRGVARSTLAARLLDPDAAEGKSELALTAVIDGAVHSLRIDRTFVDREGTRWIVDWKTSAHEGGDRDAFLENEIARYAPQLRRYAAVMTLLDPRPQKVGLYFPLLDAWREL